MLKIGVCPLPPWTYPCILETGLLTPSQNCPYPGYSAMFLDALLSQMGMAYELVNLRNETGFGTQISVHQSENRSV